MRAALHLLATVLLLSVWHPAWAEVSFKREVAQGHFKLGVKYYGVAHYNKALEEFSKAHDVESLPELLYNMGRCHEGLGDFVRALELYRRCLRDKPNPATRAAVEKRIAALEGVATSKPTPRKGQVGATGSAKEPSSPAWKKTTGWVLVAAGGAALVAGAAMGGLVSARERDYEEAAGASKTYGELEEITDEGRAFQGAHMGLLIGGGVLAAAGTGLLIWGYLHSGELSAARQVLVAPAGLGLVAAGRF